MAGSAKLSELFIDITLRGGAKAQIKSIKEQIESTDRALAKNAVFYEAVTGEKIRQMSKLAENQEQLAKVDQRTYGKLPYAGYADKQAKADVETEIAGKQKMVALSQAELRALSGKRGMELAQKTVQADRVKKQVEEVKNQQLMIAQYGKLGATIRQMGGLASMASPGALLGLGIGGLTVGHAVQQASPVHADMLSKSFDLLAAQIGTLLIPVVTSLSFALQQMSKGVESFAQKADKFEDSLPQWLKKLIDPSGLFQINKEGPRFVKPGEEQPDRPATMPAHFEAFNQAWKRIQQQAASTGPLEQRILDVQMKMLEAMNANTAALNANNNAPPAVVPVGGNAP